MRLFFLWCAVLTTAVAVGTGPGLLATALSLVGAILFIFPPYESIVMAQPLDVARLALFAIFAGGLSIVGGRMRELAERLRKSEVRYRTIVEATPVAQTVWTATPGGGPDWAREWASITGGDPDPVHPDDVACTQERWQTALANGALYEDEIRVRVATGGYRWFAVQVSPVRERERIREWVGILVDIDERKRHEENAAFINRASELLASTLASEEAMRTLARLCIPALGDWCAIHLGQDEHYQRLVAEHADPERTALLQTFGAIRRPPPEQDVIVRVLTTGKSLLVEDVSDEMLKQTMLPEQYEIVSQLGLRSWIVAP